MDQALSTLSPAALAGLIVAYLLAASRIAGPLAPLWPRLPAPWPQLAPSIMALLPQVADAFEDVNTWQSFAVSVATAIGLVLPGIMPKPPEDPPTGGDPKPGPWDDIKADTDKTPPSLPGAHRFIAIGWMTALLVGCSSAPLGPPCDQATLAGIVAECTLRSEECASKGVPEAECAALAECDRRLDQRAEVCR